MNMRSIVISLSLFCSGYGLVFSMSKKVTTFFTKATTKNLKLFYSVTKVNHKQIRSLEGNLFDTTNSSLYDSNAFFKKPYDNFFLEKHANNTTALPPVDDMPQEIQGWYERRTKKLRMGFENYFKYREHVHTQLKMIESERNKIFNDISSGKLVDFGSGTFQARGPLENLELFFNTIVSENCSCYILGGVLADCYRFNYFKADDLIKMLDACDDGSCSFEKLMKP